MPVDEHLSEATCPIRGTALEGIRDDAAAKFGVQVLLTLIPDEVARKVMGVPNEPCARSGGTSVLVRVK